MGGFGDINRSRRDLKESLLTPEWVRAALDYHPETGLMFWRLPTSKRRQQGALAGTVNKWGYRVIQINGRLYTVHRLAWFHAHGVWPEDDLDHINGDRDDNRMANLREATRSQNSVNGKLRVNNSSGFKGVCWDKSKQRWSVSVYLNGKQTRIGRFRTLEEASDAYRRAADELHGPFARSS